MTGALTVTRPGPAGTGHHPLRIVARRSPAVAALPFLAAAQLLVTWQLLWPGVWAPASVVAALVGSIQVTGPLAAGLAAYTAAAGRRRGQWQLIHLSPRPAWHAHLLDLAALTLWCLAGCLAVSAGVGGWALAQGGHLDPVTLLWWLAAPLTLTVHVIVGHLAGRALPRLWAPPLVAVATFVLAGWVIAGRNPWAKLLSPISVRNISLFRDIDPMVVAGQLLWYLGLCLLGLAVVVAFSDGRWRLAAPLAAVTGAFLTTGLAVLIANGPGFFRDTPAAFTYVCSGTNPQVCVHPAMAKGLPELTVAFADLNRQVAGTPLVGTRYEQRPRGVGQDPSPGAAAFHLDDLSPRFATDSAHEYIENNLPGVTCPHADNEEVNFLPLIPYYWLTGEDFAFLQIDPVLRTASDRFMSLTEGGRTAWLVKHYDKLASCTLKAGDFR